MFNTVMAPTGDRSELREMQRALEALVHAGFVRMSMDRDPTGRLRDLSVGESLDVIADLESGLRFKRDNTRWTDTRHSGPPYGSPFPYIVSTEAGQEKAFQILDERGYQWWRSKK